MLGAGTGDKEGCDRGRIVGEAVGDGIGFDVGSAEGGGEGFLVAIAVATEDESTVAPVSDATNDANDGAEMLVLKLSANEDGVEAPGINASDTTTVNDTSQV